MIADHVRRALLIGNSDGIGAALTSRLLRSGWQIASLSRRPCPVDGVMAHVTADVTAPDYAQRLCTLWDEHGPFDTCVYLVGVANDFDAATCAGEVEVMETNLQALVRTVAAIGPRMVAAGRGHFLGVSSLADGILNAGCPSYSASKAGMTSYLNSLSLALRAHNVAVTAVRFGFVNTKMAIAGARPLMVSADRAAAVIQRSFERRPAQVSYPKMAALATHIAGRLQRLRIWWNR